MQEYLTPVNLRLLYSRVISARFSSEVTSILKLRASFTMEILFSRNIKLRGIYYDEKEKKDTEIKKRFTKLMEQAGYKAGG